MRYARIMTLTTMQSALIAALFLDVPTLHDRENVISSFSGLLEQVQIMGYDDGANEFWVTPEGIDVESEVDAMLTYLDLDLDTLPESLPIKLKDLFLTTYSKNYTEGKENNWFAS